MLALDLTWLGVIAKGIYDSALATLRRPDVLLPAAALFYAFYVSFVVGYAVVGARSRADAARRGALLGLATYGTYDLTNWAVIRDWSATLVPIDMAWGVVLTAVVALVGRLVFERLTPASPS